MKYAIIENGIVTNVALAGGPIAPNWVETDTAGIGWTYSNGVFAAPVIPEPPVTRSITVLAFRSRFTQAEKQAIYTAAKSSVDLQIWLDDLAVATEVILDDDRTLAGLQAMESAGFIGAGRAAEILA